MTARYNVIVFHHDCSYCKYAALWEVKLSALEISTSPIPIAPWSIYTSE